MTAAKEPSVDEIVRAYEAAKALGLPQNYLGREYADALISDWRKRGEARDSARVELDVLSASHKDLAHRLARMGEEFEKAQLINECHCTNIEATTSEIDQAEAERDSARALLREAVPHIERAMIPYKDGWIDEKRYILARIAKELGPTREDEPRSPVEDNGEGR